MINITLDEFKKLPLVVEGESKEIRYLGNGLCLQYLKPTIYSFSKNRCGIVEGSNIPRLKCTKIFLELLKHVGVDHAYIDVGENFILSKLMLEDPSEYNPTPFMPTDLTEKEISKLKRVPPIEVVIKRFHGGTTKHEMYGMCGYPVRKNHKHFPGICIDAESPYPMPIVRFDWRNPLKDNNGVRLADKALSSDMANFFINVDTASFNAKKVYHVISDFLAYCDIICNDICMFFTTDGCTMYGEISPDCGRFRHYDLGSLDKDVWRAGGSSEEVVAKWNLMATIIESKWSEYKNVLPVIDVSKIKYCEDLPIYFGTSNPYKVSEMLSELTPYYKNVHIAPESDIEETGTTFEENAIIKAKDYAKLSGGITIAEDSGLVISGLCGKPGVHSARFSMCELSNRSYNILSISKSILSRNEIDANNRKFIIKLLNDVVQNNAVHYVDDELEAQNAKDLSAYFECCFAVVDKNSNVLYTCSGKSYGSISLIERGENGFGYDSIFVGNDTHGLTYAELDPYRKNLRSHRTKALRKLRIWLETHLYSVVK